MYTQLFVFSNFFVSNEYSVTHTITRVGSNACQDTQKNFQNKAPVDRSLPSPAAAAASELMMLRRS